MPLVIFVFKTAAKTLLGPFPGNGLLRGQKIAGAKVFVMPGPTAPRENEAAALRQLKRLL